MFRTKLKRFSLQCQYPKTLPKRVKTEKRQTFHEIDYAMYGYADYGETCKRTLGLGDINGLEAVYGP